MLFADAARFVSAPQSPGQQAPLIYNFHHHDLDFKTGRWTPEEKRLFEEALHMYGRNLEKIHRHVGPSRTIVQIRSHAQKYFKKLHKSNPELAAMYASSRDPSAKLTNTMSNFNSLLYSAGDQLDDVGGSEDAMSDTKGKEDHSDESSNRVLGIWFVLAEVF